MGKTKRSWFRVLLRRRLFVIFLLLLQIAFIIFIFRESYISGILQAVVSAISVMLAFYVISKKDKGANKVAWVFLLLLFPVFGSLFYLLYYFQASTRKFSSKCIRIDEENRKYYMLPGDAFDEAEHLIPQHLPQVRYLQEFVGYPVYNGTRTEYFSPGEKFLPVFLEELEKAENYIFMEYFIIQEGVMWNAVLDILKRKASQGIEVRILYDDIGCFLTLPKDFAARMEDLYHVHFSPDLCLCAVITDETDSGTLEILLRVFPEQEDGGTTHFLTTAFRDNTGFVLPDIFFR